MKHNSTEKTNQNFINHLPDFTWFALENEVTIHLSSHSICLCIVNEKKIVIKYYIQWLGTDRSQISDLIMGSYQLGKIILLICHTMRSFGGRQTCIQLQCHLNSVHNYFMYFDVRFIFNTLRLGCTLCRNHTESFHKYFYFYFSINSISDIELYSVESSK